MPALEEANLYQKAILWPNTGAIDDQGNPTLGPPVVLPCRWVMKRVQSVRPDGTSIGLDAQVDVKQKIELGGNMWLSPLGIEASDADVLSAWYGVGSAGESTEVMRVETYSNTPDVSRKFYKHSVGLTRHKDDPGSS